MMVTSGGASAASEVFAPKAPAAPAADRLARKSRRLCVICIKASFVYLPRGVRAARLLKPLILV
jgi:hypothetical protein